MSTSSGMDISTSSSTSINQIDLWKISDPNPTSHIYVVLRHLLSTPEYEPILTGKMHYTDSKKQSLQNLLYETIANFRQYNKHREWQSIALLNKPNRPEKDSLKYSEFFFAEIFDRNQLYELKQEAVQALIKQFIACGFHTSSQRLTKSEDVFTNLFSYFTIASPSEIRIHEQGDLTAMENDAIESTKPIQYLELQVLGKNQNMQQLLDQYFKKNTIISPLPSLLQIRLGDAKLADEHFSMSTRISLDPSSNNSQEAAVYTLESMTTIFYNASVYWQKTDPMSGLNSNWARYRVTAYTSFTNLDFMIGNDFSQYCCFYRKTTPLIELCNNFFEQGVLSRTTWKIITDYVQS